MMKMIQTIPPLIWKVGTKNEMIMKAFKIFSLLAVLAIALTGCIEDDFGMASGPAKIGDEIMFGGTAGYGGKTRTVYGDKWTDDKYTEIKWYTGDQVRIYCEQAMPVVNGDEEVLYCDYNVVNGLGVTENPKDGKKDKGHPSSLSAIGVSGLKWGAETNHTFYGVYPAPGQLANNDADELSKQAAGKLDFNFENKTLTGYLPNRQTPLSGMNFVQKFSNDYIVYPAMRYAYMVATTTGHPANTTPVSLSFNPVVTAVEITLVNKSANFVDGDLESYNDIEGIEGFVVSSDKQICGDFTVDITTGTNTLLQNTETHKQIFIPAEIGLLKYGESVTFTAFMMLDKSVTGLKDLIVSIITESGVKSSKLSGKNDGIIVYAKKKNFLNNVNMNLGSVVYNRNANNWVKYIPDTKQDGTDVLVRNLSIPGAGGAASKSIYDKGGDNVNYAQQTLTIAEQWAQGIRCFEFAVDILETNMVDEPVICNGQITDKTLGTVVNEVRTCLLASPDEFAMVIVTYQNTNGFVEYNASAPARNPETFMERLGCYWNTLGDNWTATGNKTHNNSIGPALFKSDLTIANARGKLFCIARPTSQYEDDFTIVPKEGDVIKKGSQYVTYDKSKLSVSNTNDNIFVINGWGSLKDKWEARGYTKSLFYRGKEGTGYNGQVSYSPDYNSSEKGRPFDASTLKGNYKDNAPKEANYVANTAAGRSNFYYASQAGVGTKVEESVWAQEWARVSPTTSVFGDDVNSGVYATFSDANDNTVKRVIYWAPTFEEKKLRVEETLYYALNRYDDNKGKGDIIYINSLCGYYIDPNITISCVPNANTEWGGCRCDRYGTESSYFTKYWKVKKLTACDSQSGMAGNIADYARDINNYFYRKLTDMQASGLLNSGLGIVLMDRISDSPEVDPAGYYIPQIIWNCNDFTE